MLQFTRNNTHGSACAEKGNSSHEGPVHGSRHALEHASNCWPSAGTPGSVFTGPFPSPQFPAASKASVFAQRSEGRQLERRLLLMMRFDVPLEHGKGVEMRVELPSWLGNREHRDILSLLHLNILTALFFNGPSARD